jgi:hypothetical protein
MRKNIKFSLFPLLILLFFFNSCTKEDSSTPEGIDGSWTLVSWVENGTAEPNVSQAEITLSFTNVVNGTGIMTFTTSVIPFNYTGTYSIDANNLLTATLDETTGEMEINQWIMSMDVIMGSNDLKLEGSILEKSPFWPDNTENVVFEATR